MGVAGENTRDSGIMKLQKLFAMQEMRLYGISE